MIDGERLEAIHLVEETMSLVMDIKFTESHNRQETQRSEQRRVSVGYAEERTLDTAIGDVQYICAFMSTMLGFVITPIDLEFRVSYPENRFGERYQFHSQFKYPPP